MERLRALSEPATSPQQKFDRSLVMHCESGPVEGKPLTMRGYRNYVDSPDDRHRKNDGVDSETYCTAASGEKVLRTLPTLTPEEIFTQNYTTGGARSKQTRAYHTLASQSSCVTTYLQWWPHRPHVSYCEQCANLWKSERCTTLLAY